jgi:hypothetical protein
VADKSRASKCCAPLTYPPNGGVCKLSPNGQVCPSGQKGSKKIFFPENVDKHIFGPYTIKKGGKKMGEKLPQYQQKYSNKNTNITVKCTPKQKMKFDEIVEKTNKSKTEYILGWIEDTYRELFLNK